jgi:hypothetical protein
VATAQSNVPEFVLTIISGGDPGQSFVFQQQEVTLGRVANNDLVLYDPEVSRRHLVIYFESQQWIVEDLGSSNGTILNGQRLYYPATLQEGDILEVSAVAFRFASSQSPASGFSYEAMPQPPAQPEQAATPFVQFRDQLPPQQQELRSEPTRQHMVQEKLAQLDQQPAFQQAAPTGQFPAQSQPVAPPPPPQSPSKDLLGAPPPPAPAAQGPLQLQDLMNAPQPFFTPQATVGTVEEQPQAERPAPKPIGIARPSMPHPSKLPQNKKPKPQAYSYGMLPQAEENLVLTEGRVRLLVGLCIFLLLLGGALFVVPLPKSLKRKAAGNTIRLTATNQVVMAKKVFGYNQYSKNTQMLRKIHFVFQHKGGKVTLQYRLNCPDTLELWLNGALYLRLSPTPSRTWVFKRHSIPRARLKLNGLNRITFHRKTGRRKRFWGVTQFRLKDMPYPLPSQEMAQRYCQKGHALFKQKERSLNKRFLALKAFQRCKDYMELLQRKPQLYYMSKMMISQIDNELEVLYLKHLRRARKAKQVLQSKQIYHTLLKYFPSKSDPRHQRIQQLLRN